MKNSGFGWKIHGKVKAELDPRIVFENAKARQELLLRNRPAYRAWHKAITGVALTHRWKLIAAIELMPTDPDGVWSECCDGYGDNLHMDVGEVLELCNLYLAAVDEANRLERT
jgi:hypothetical protein